MATKGKKTTKSKKPFEKAAKLSLLSQVFQNFRSRSFRTKLVVVLFGVAFAGLIYYFKGLFVAATVNGQVITRLALVREIEKQAGQQILDGLITKAIILQEAKKQKITVSKEEINQEVQKIEESLKAQNQNLDDVLALENLSREELSERLELQKIIEQLAGKDIQITDEEINQYFEENKSFYPEASDEAKTKSQIKEQLRQQKINQNFQTILQSLKNAAKINYFVSF